MQAILDGDIARPPDARLSALAKLLGTSLEALLKLVSPDRRDKETVVQGSFRAAVAVAPCAFGLVSNAITGAADHPTIEVQVTPAGAFVPRDGRDMLVSAWRIDSAIAAQVIARFRANITPLVLDYEHQTLNAEFNGQPAPAAGFFRELVWRDGQGLFATVELTARAAQFVRDGEYRYFSPIFSYDSQTGAVLKLEMGALTNNPALDGMQPAALRAAARFGLNHNQESNTMDLLAEIRTLLGLSADAADADILDAIKAATTKPDQSAALRAELGVADDAGADAVLAACRALKTTRPDPARFVPVATVDEMRSQLAALSARVLQTDLDALVQPALADGRLLAPQEAWARELGASNIASLKTYLDAAKPIAALKGSQTKGEPPASSDGDANLNAEELAVCRATGIDPIAFAKARAA
ncbi:MAG: hypothetical protein CVV18_00330 [Gammaproteobacteria bacterium HGW-Gammaproteobacteria-8]|nr:MAG: hypothetical protein CVV18_00330 [Gammaproteobacteria bacterium HGW-Gammaproteobacteria-8]